MLGSGEDKIVINVLPDKIVSSILYNRSYNTRNGLKIMLILSNIKAFALSIIAFQLSSILAELTQ